MDAGLMKRMRALRVVMVGLAGLLLGGCMPSQMVEEGRYYLGDAGLLDNYRFQRGGNWRLQADSRLYIAQSHFVPVGHTGARPNILAEEAFAAAVQVFPQVRRAEQPLGLDEALGKARQQGMDYLLYTRFASARASGEGATEWPAEEEAGVGREHVIVQLLLSAASAWRPVHLTTLESRPGFADFGRSRPQDPLRDAMQPYSRQLVGSG